MLQIEQTKNNVAKLPSLYTLKKKKMAGEIMQVEQTKITVASNNSLFLYLILTCKN